MEPSSEKDCSILGSLFQTIINDLRSGSPVWEDFTYKATKLHSCLKTTLVAIGSFLEAFQKVADMATNSKGATKEIGSALTRLCMRHRNIETNLKALTSSILDSLVAPLQEKLEDWKKVVVQLDKDHAKEYKKARQEIKKAASDTMRLQKKVKKSIPHGKNEMQSKLESAMVDVNAKYQQLEETEKHSVRTALIEERGRFCLFISCIKPFVDHEVHLLTEITHLQEIMHSLCLQASEPNTLPASSEQVITDLKGVDPAIFHQHPSPPSSPSSLGSRKSSMCSINSINSSSSSSSHSPSHTMHKRTASQASNSDSTDTADCDSTPTTPSANFAATPTATSAINSFPDPITTQKLLQHVRPHTISGGGEKPRPALKPELFEPLPESHGTVEMREKGPVRGGSKHRSSSSSAPYARQSATINKMQPVLPPHCPRPKIKAVPPPTLPPGAQPVYANTVDLHRLAMENQAAQVDNKGGEESAVPAVTVSQQASQMQQNSLELAAAIRELEESTAALQSTYDTASHTSHTSLQCSSGYATMNSTPSGSEDTICSGDFDFSSVGYESEKYYTIPRSGEMSAAYRAALFPKRPASTAGVPASGTNLSRRGSINSSKPAPPVRKTASISSVLKCSDGESPTVTDVSFGADGLYQVAEGAYAELQLIQQNIQQKQKKQPAPPSKLAQLHRQCSNESSHMSSPSADRCSLSSGGSSHYAVPNLPISPGQASVIHSLTAKFAALQNQQYQGENTYVSGAPVHGGDPNAASLMPPPPVPNKQEQSLSQRSIPPGPSLSIHSPQSGQGIYSGHSHYYSHAMHEHGQQQKHQTVESHGHPVPSHHGNIHGQLQQGAGEIDFPLPPTAEELEEIEKLYARPLARTNNMQINLMMELKKKMSLEEASDV